MAPESAAYHVGFALKIQSQPDVAVMKVALQRLIDRHAMLRTTFSLEDGELTQTTAGAADVCFKVVDVTKLSSQEIDATVRDAYRDPFDLQNGPLFRAHLFEQGNEESILLITVHHIVYDGWSLWLNLEELGSMYCAELKGLSPMLPSPRPLYADYVKGEQNLLEQEDFDSHWKYWNSKLNDSSTPLDIPTDKPRPKIQRYHGASCDFRIPEVLTQRITSLARENNVTAFIVLLTAFQILLNRYSRQEEITVGVPVIGHNRPDYPNTVGYFVNQVPVRVNMSNNSRFTSFLEATKETFFEALEHQSIPFPLLVERLCSNRDPSFSPLVQASFVYQKSQADNLISRLFDFAGSDQTIDWAGMPVQLYPLHQQEGQFDIQFELIEAGKGMYGIVKYDSTIFSEDTAKRMQEHYLQLLTKIVDNPDRGIRDYPLLSHEERKRFTQSSGPVTSQVSSLTELFRDAVAMNPEAIAVHSAGRNISYAELDRRSNQLARYLIQCGVGPECTVGVYLPRSSDVVISIVAIVKAGGVYVPIDPDSPADRVKYILQDASVNLIVTNEQLSVDGAGGDNDVIALDALSDVIDAMSCKAITTHPSQKNTAYVIYTSGSTGRPKGVMVTHANVARLFFATENRFKFSSRDVWTLFHSIAFDFSVWELWGALLYGGRLVVVPYDTSRSPDDFYKLLCEQKVTILNQTPSAFRQLIAAEERIGMSENLALRKVIFGGEALDPSSLASWFRRHGDKEPQLVNMYGITETTVHVTYRPMTAEDAESSSSNIGKPISDLDVYVLDENLEPVPVGVSGEMFVGGAGVANGYLDRPELTEQRFIPNHFSRICGDRLYRTGDLARWLHNGDLEYLGRIDSQVKIRGFRIELGEIQSQLSKHESVVDAAVSTRKFDEDDVRLVAWIVPQNADQFDVATLLADLGAFLPSYMLPSHIVPMDLLPLTDNGKLDLANLPDPRDESSDIQTQHSPPVTSIEIKLVEIWKNVLGLGSMGIRDDFFSVGGHSLLAIRIMSAIETEFNVKLPVSTLFQYSTIEQLSKAVEGYSEKETSTLVPMRESGANPPFFCVAGGGGNVAYFGDLVNRLNSEQPFLALQAPGIDGSCDPLLRVEDIANVHIDSIRAVQPEGPYQLGGHCFGAHVAFEMARQLTDAGEKVESIIVIDAPAPLRPAPDLSHLDEHVWLQKIGQALEEASGRLLHIDDVKLQNLDTEDQHQYFYERMVESELLESSASPDQARAFVDVFKANTQAQYVPKVCLDIPLYLIRAADWHEDYDYSDAFKGDGNEAESNLGWGNLTHKKVHVSTVPGNHLTMLGRDNVVYLAQKLESCLTGKLPQEEALSNSSASISTTLNLEKSQC